MTYTVGMLGPIELAQFRDALELDPSADGLPSGTGGTPVGLLSRELLDRGRRVVLATLDPIVEDELVLEGPNLKICFGAFRPNRAHDFFAAERAFLTRVMRRERPDFVHAQWTYEYALAAQASGLPHVITAHDAPLNVLRHNFIPYRIARTLMAYRVLSRAKRVVSVSPYVAKHLSRFMLYRGRREVIPNGMPESLFASHVGLRGSGPPTFASILQGWGGRKNGKVAIEAFAEVRRRQPDARLLLFGYGHGPGEGAEGWAARRGLTAGIEFAGEQPYGTVIERLAREVDVLVHPALEEAQCMVLIEAMALGVPTIAGQASGGVPWTVDDGKAGVLVDVTDPSAVAGAMERLASDDKERREWAERGRELATRRFHIGRVADAYERIYSELLGGSEEVGLAPERSLARRGRSDRRHDDQT
jgi:L-malate glycosyltransferase